MIEQLPTLWIEGIGPRALRLTGAKDGREIELTLYANHAGRGMQVQRTPLGENHERVILRLVSVYDTPFTVYLETACAGNDVRFDLLAIVADDGHPVTWSEFPSYGGKTVISVHTHNEPIATGSIAALPQEQCNYVAF